MSDHCLSSASFRPTDSSPRRECIADESYVALIKLTPLDAPNELPRIFALNPVTDHIDVGRASKNESKGLVAAKENAWFDSPIMSRQHARFNISTAHKVRAHSIFRRKRQPYLT